MPLQAQLATLEASGLIRLAQVQPELEYLFRHVLIQDAAYGSLVRSDRRRLHRVVGEALERGYPDRVDELAPLLARHFEEAGDEERALRYFTQAGDAAFRRYASTESAAFYARALELAQRGPSDGPSLKHLFSQRGRAFELAGQFESALANYEAMEAQAQSHADGSLELAALMAQAQLRCTATPLFDIGRGETLLGQALQRAQALGDRAAQAKILWNFINLYRFSNRQSQALEVGARSLALARELGLEEQQAYTLNDLAHVFAATGDLAQGRRSALEASQLWRALDNRAMLADSLGTASMYHGFAGDYEAALTLSGEAFRISQSIDNLWGQSYSRSAVGNILWERGEPDRAIAVMEEVLRLAERAGYMFPLTATRSELALIFGQLGAVERGLEIARQALAHAEALFPSIRPMAWAALARLYLLQGQVAEAATLLQNAQAHGLPVHPWLQLPMALAECHLALALGDYEAARERTDDLLGRLRQYGVRSPLPETLYLRGLAQLALGQVDAARASFAEAQTEAEALTSRRMLWQILAALGRIEAERGNAVEAGTLRRQARQILEHIAEHASRGSPELGASFLGLPEVRDALDEDPGVQA